MSLLMAGGLVAMSTAAFAGSASAAKIPKKSIPITTLDFGLSDANAGYMPAYIAEDQGFFAKNHLKVNLVPFTGGGSAVEAAMESGSVQGVLGGLEYFAANAEGVTQVKIVGEMEASHYGIYVTPGITSGKDLIGKKIGTSSLSGAEFIYWHFVLNYFGVSPSQVTFVVISGGAGKIAALENGAVNAIIDDPTQVVGIGQDLLYAPTKIPQVPLATYVFNDSFLRNHTEAMKEFFKSVDEADAWIFAKKSNLAVAQAECTDQGSQQGPGLLASECSLSSEAPHRSNAYTWTGTNALDIPGWSKAYAAACQAISASCALAEQDTMDTQFVGTNPRYIQDPNRFKYIAPANYVK